MKNYKEYNKLNEDKTSFTITLGRAHSGFQRNCYQLANALGIGISINRMPSILDVTYRVALDGDAYSINKFVGWVNSSRYIGNKGEQEEEG